jgi:hypothetical protein
MAIHVNITLHGGEIGQALLQEHEEFYYALDHIAADESEEEMRHLAQSVAAYATGRAGQIAKFLRILAEEIEANG